MIGSPARYIAPLLGIVSPIGAVLEFGGYSSPLVQQGLGAEETERVIVYPLLIWLMMFVGYLSVRKATRDERIALFRTTGLVVFIQIALGGLVTFGVVSLNVGNFDFTTLLHVIMGIMVSVFVVFTAVAAIRSKPPYKGLRKFSMSMLVILVVQVTIGFTLFAVVDAALSVSVHLLIGVRYTR